MPHYLHAIVAVLTASLFHPIMSSAAQPGQEDAIGQLTDRAIPPESIADAIVDFVPSEYLPLHIPSPNKRTIKGITIKLERGPALLPIIVHSANTLITALDPGVPVKLFLKQDPRANEYYVIAVLPVSYDYKGKP